MLTRRLNPYVTFLALTILISAIASTLSHAITDPARRTLVGAAASLDLTLTVGFLYYWLLVRPGLRSKATMFVVALLGLWRAAFLFPDVIPGKVGLNKLWIGGGLELAVVAALGAALWKSRKLPRGGDPVARIRLAFDSFIPVPTAARALASEFAVLYYAFFAWRAHPHVPARARPFTMHKTTMAADLFYCMAGISLLEVVPVHLFAAHWSPTAAWILTGLSLYGAVWISAMARAFTLRPTLVGPEGIVIRYGLLFHLTIPADQIRPTRAPVPGALIMPRNTQPSLYLEFSEPLEAELILGLRKRVSAIGLTLDDPAAFAAAINA